MRAPSIDRITGLVLLVLATVWVILVWRTIPPGAGPVGPRTLPLGLGVALAVLSAWLMWFGTGEAEEPAPDPAPAAGDWVTLRMVLATFLSIAVYGVLMERIGFVFATAAVVLALLWLALGIRDTRKLVGMTIGIPIGCWLVFGKLLGSHLPRSPWFSLF